jgi:chemotaxis signal transduction protein
VGILVNPLDQIVDIEDKYMETVAQILKATETAYIKSVANIEDKMNILLDVGTLLNLDIYNSSGLME